MKNFTFLRIGALFLSLQIAAQGTDNSFWVPANERQISLTGKRQIIPQKYLAVSLKDEFLKLSLFSAPHEKNVAIEQSPCVIILPLPGGSLQRFYVVESPIMSEELSAAFPHMKTFSVKGLDDRYASGKLDWNEFGFHAMIFSPEGDFFIDPYCVANTVDYISYFTSDFVKDPSQRIPETTPETPEDANTGKKKVGAVEQSGSKPSQPPAACVGGQLRSYRLAIACTGEYAVAATGSATPSIAQTLSKIQTSINRVDGVYEKEVAVRLVLVSTETLVIFTTASTDPFNGNNNANTLISESQTIITNTIGSANFDIGHTFSTGGGGLAFLGVVCTNSSKARGITGSPNPVGDPYDIDYVAHEIGHQFRGNHTFNAITGSCNGNRSGSTAVEPGSGITIMGYAGICSSNDVAGNSIPYFHAISYDEIVNFTQTSTGNSCPTIITTTNNPPLVTGSGNYIIPKNTPFVLTGSGADPDGDPIVFSWEETDAGTGSGANWNSGSKPFFRSYAPATTPLRLFPKNLAVVNNNFTGVIGEYLPQNAQTLNFRLTARDNKMGGGGVCYAASTITVDNSGPLNVTYPNATGIIWGHTLQKTVTWDVNSTDVLPVDCDTVSLWISYDNGNNYTMIVASTPNDGLHAITVPTVTQTINTCRMRVQAKGNIFYDISNNNFTITTDITIGLGESAGNSLPALTIWPNPAGETINLVAGNLDASSPTVVSISDLLGKTLFERTFNNKSELKELLDLSKLSEGMYLLRLTNGSKQSVERLVKN